VPPALAAAIHDATGHRPNTLPITPDRLLQDLVEHRRAQKRGARGGAGTSAAATTGTTTKEAV